MGRNKIGRNELCHCGSELKFKRCHGDPVKLILAKQAYTDKLNELIEKQKGKKHESN